jgi:hypothetical protein
MADEKAVPTFHEALANLGQVYGRAFAAMEHSGALMAAVWERLPTTVPARSC